MLGQMQALLMGKSSLIQSIVTGRSAVTCSQSLPESEMQDTEKTGFGSRQS